ncbi:uncharacterized protein [Halyomorpha halys]|uniref:uncharacterized protein n=1 Tax=Halyomorpha halys TaxID=286706 RepID=UPI0006D4DD06|nr:uncharacterized protein LOC106681933 [Halyomorpha halys]
MNQFGIDDHQSTDGNGNWNEEEYDEVIEKEEVERVIYKMRTEKAPRWDGVVAELIKNGCPEQVRALQVLYQKAWDEKRIPTNWEYNIIIPIHKKTCQAECSNYRPICLSPVAYKLYTSILVGR